MDRTMNWTFLIEMSCLAPLAYKVLWNFRKYNFEGWPYNYKKRPRGCRGGLYEGFHCMKKK